MRFLRVAYRAADNGRVDLSILIPTYRRPTKLAACITALARQTLAPDRFEILIGLDGPDAESEAAARAAAPHLRSLRITTCERQGYNAVRNALLKQARGRYLLSLNDDVIPEPALLEIHLREQQQAESRGQPAIITGYSPWKLHADDTLFDRLVRETSMVFFYDRMLQHPKPSDHDWGFRHCWGLNFSAPLAMVREVGGFTAIPLAYGYDDIEIAWRLQQRYRTPVLFRPEARAEHDHRYSPREVLDRELKLGQAAWHFAKLNPAFAQAVFGRDITAEAELAYPREFIQREQSAADRLERTFLRLADIPAAAIEGPHAPALIEALYQQHLLLKRHTWRRGLLSAASSS
jgi:glycosyltransferase involved in cell wall biosynthesis